MRSRARAFAHPTLLPYVACIGILGIGGGGIVLQRAEIARLANHREGMKAAIEKCERRLKAAEMVVAKEQSVEVLLRRNEEWGLGLAPPAEARITRAGAATEERAAARRNRASLTEGPVAPAGAGPAVVFRLPGAAGGR
ncbi:MAG: hypothetical protein LBR12_05235 [Opitutaceae bacterium]|jgi:hypothetical protein|nr:hypothetical protein [Opitutaceae bacterium]